MGKEMLRFAQHDRAFIRTDVQTVLLHSIIGGWLMQELLCSRICLLVVRKPAESHRLYIHIYARDRMRR